MLNPVSDEEKDEHLSKATLPYVSRGLDNIPNLFKLGSKCVLNIP